MQTPEIALPPQNVEAEGAILSTMLFDSSVCADIIDGLLEDDFYRTHHRKVFSAAKDIYRESEAVDGITLMAKLKDRGELMEVGGAAFIAALSRTPSAPSVDAYIKIIKDLAVRRRLIATANEINRRAMSDADAESVLNDAQREITAVDYQSAGSVVRLKDVMSDVIDTLEGMQGNKGGVTGIPSGYTDLDHLTCGFQRSDLIIIAARPSMGKSALAFNISREAAEAGYGSLVFSLEMSRQQVCQRQIASDSRVNLMRFRSARFSQDDWMRITDSAGRMDKWAMYLDDTPGLHYQELRRRARRLKRRVGGKLGLVLVDYIQLMQGDKKGSREGEVASITRNLKAMAKELDLPVVALAQLNRDLEKRPKNDRRPKLSDLRESGAIEQDADVVMFIYRDEVYNPDECNPNRGVAEIIVAKQRNGPTGSVNLGWLAAYTRFENLATDRYHETLRDAGIN